MEPELVMADRKVVRDVFVPAHGIDLSRHQLLCNSMDVWWLKSTYEYCMRNLSRRERNFAVLSRYGFGGSAEVTEEEKNVVPYFTKSNAELVYDHRRRFEDLLDLHIKLYRSSHRSSELPPNDPKQIPVQRLVKEYHNAARKYAIWRE